MVDMLSRLAAVVLAKFGVLLQVGHDVVEKSKQQQRGVLPCGVLKTETPLNALARLVPEDPPVNRLPHYRISR
jgi:hypothetical protein